MDGGLTAAVLKYQETGEGWERLRKKICLYAYHYPRRWTDWNEDQRSSFFLDFLPKIPQLVDRYRPRGRDFEIYLRSTLRWALRTFANRQRSARYRSRFAMQTAAENVEFAAESGEPYAASVHPAPADGDSDGADPGTVPFDLDDKGAIADPFVRKRFTYLLILNAAGLEDRAIPGAAVLVGQSPRWLEERVRAARDLLDDRMERRRKLRERRNECWYRRCALRYRMNEETDPMVLEDLASKARTWLDRYESAVRALEKLSLVPTHKDVADILDVPKGTVDSGLWLIRRRLKEAGDPLDATAALR